MRRILVCGFVVAALALAACGGTLEYNIASSRLAPGADAVIKATVNEDQNQTAVDVTMKNLPPAGRVNPQARFYVVWQRKGEGVWLRVGNILFDEEARTGTFKGTIPEKSFELEISAEANEGAQAPSADVVFSQKVN